MMLAVLTGLIPVVLTGRVSGQWFSTGMIPVVFTGIRTHPPKYIHNLLILQ